MNVVKLFSNAQSKCSLTDEIKNRGWGGGGRVSEYIDRSICY